jgi:DNA-binding NtrC family response regulator
VGHATRILIVDDDPLMRFALGQTLSDSGCDVAEAADGAAATRALTATTSPFDVVLLDFQMPDSRDLQLLSRVQSLSPASRVIMMTAYPTPELLAGATRAGAVCVLNKPIDFDELCRLVTPPSRPAPPL